MEFAIDVYPNLWPPADICRDETRLGSAMDILAKFLVIPASRKTVAFWLVKFCGALWRCMDVFWRLDVIVKRLWFEFI